MFMIKKLTFIAVLLSATSSVSAVDRWKCQSGDVPKFKDNEATYYVEPELWDDRTIRTSIVDAFNEWNNATGYKLKFTAKRGSGSGSFGDGRYQVRAQWIPGTLIGRSVAIPTSDSGQCHWYDNDIQLNQKYINELSRGTGTSQHTLYTIMLHEIGHAIGMQHNRHLSVVNKGSENVYGSNRAIYDGLFGHDIRFIRNVYGMNINNIRTNYRADNVVLDPRTRIMNSFFTTSVRDGTARVPYTVTNEGTKDKRIKISIVTADRHSDLYNGKAQKVAWVYRYIYPGNTASGFVNFRYSESSPPERIGFIVDLVDSNNWDNGVLTW